MGYKTWRSIEMTLDPKSIKQALRELEECKRQLVEALTELTKTLQEQGVQVAKMQVASFDAVDSGELEHSIFGHYNEQSRIGYIIAGAPHAFYVEYGTGAVGADAPHPMASEAGWEYMVGPHIKEGPGGLGWWYDKSSDGVFSGDGDYHWTRGQPARPFMYNTFVWLEEAAQALGRNIFT